MTNKMADGSRFSSNVFCVVLVGFVCYGTTTIPIVVNTWPFTNATSAAWDKILKKGSSVDAVVAGCSECEVQQCDGTVGYGGDPDEKGEVTLDAMVMDGKTMSVGAVGCIRRIKNAIGVARAVMDYTQHTLLVGELATQFAVEMGFSEESLSTNRSQNIETDWKNKKCQPNFRKNVTPDPTINCGPYKPIHQGKLVKGDYSRKHLGIDKTNHDTIGMVVIDSDGNIASGTTTNGLNHKIPGRVGDSPVMGAGSYAVNDVGGAASTGDGDIMMRFLPAFNAVTMMGMGMDPDKAAEKALTPIIKFYPTFSGAIITVNAKGEVGAACHGFAVFRYSVVNTTAPVSVLSKDCANKKHNQ